MNTEKYCIWDEVRPPLDIKKKRMREKQTDNSDRKRERERHIVLNQYERKMGFFFLEIINFENMFRWQVRSVIGIYIKRKRHSQLNFIKQPIQIILPNIL